MSSLVSGADDGLGAGALGRPWGPGVAFSACAPASLMDGAVLLLRCCAFLTRVLPSHMLTACRSSWLAEGASGIRYNRIRAPVVRNRLELLSFCQPDHHVQSVAAHAQPVKQHVAHCGSSGAPASLEQLPQLRAVWLVSWSRANRSAQQLLSSRAACRQND